jgi:hypothetical protein
MGEDTKVAEDGSEQDEEATVIAVDEGDDTDDSNLMTKLMAQLKDLKKTVTEQAGVIEDLKEQPRSPPLLSFLAHTQYTDIYSGISVYTVIYRYIAVYT